MLKYIKNLLTKYRTKSKENTPNSVEEKSNRPAFGDSVEPIDGTPFTLVQKDGKWFITMGEYTLTEKYDTEDEAMEQPGKEMWHTILRMIVAVIHKQQNTKE